MLQIIVAEDMFVTSNGGCVVVVCKGQVFEKTFGGFIASSGVVAFLNTFGPSDR